MNILGNLNNLYLQISRTNKYSNDTLFGRRETEYSSRVKLTSPTSRISSALQRPYSSTLKVSLFNNHKRKIPNISKTKSTFSSKHPKSALKSLFHEENYFYKNSSKTNSNSRFKSFIEFERYYHPKTNINMSNINTKRNNMNIKTISNVCNDNIDYINTIYLTEANTKKATITTKDLISNIDYDNTISITNNNLNKHKNADILSKFMKDRINFNRKEDLKRELKDKTTDYKTKKINLKKESYSEYREKMRNEKIFKFSLKSKDELCKRTKEQYQNELGFINDKIESCKTWKKINQDFFIDKIDEYLKFLMYQKSYEKNKVEDLVDDIINLKNDITRINSRMAKIELEKGKIMRWIFFQIKLKEKKVTLPSYYSTILENLNDINTFYEIKAKKLTTSYAPKMSENNKYNNNLSLSVKKRERDKMKKSIKKTRVFHSLDNAELPNLKNELVVLLNKTEVKEAYKRIKEYKTHLIYTVDEFVDRMSMLESENITLIKYHTDLKYKINEFQKQLDKLTEEKNRISEAYNYNLNIKLNDLNRLKINHTAMENIVNVFKTLYYFKIDKKKKQRTRLLSNDDNEEQDDLDIGSIITPISMIKINKKKKEIKNQNKSKNKKFTKEMLFIKIAELYHICKQIKFNDEKHYEILREREKIFKNFGVLYSIFFIEYSVNYLLNYARDFEKNNKDGKKKMKKILFEIEKAHREEKAEEMRNQRLQKHIKLEKEINNRYNKIYLHNTQVTLNHITKKKKRKIEEIKTQKLPSLNDFLFKDSSDEFNTNQNLIEEEKQS